MKKTAFSLVGGIGPFVKSLKIMKVMDLVLQPEFN